MKKKTSSPENKSLLEMWHQSFSRLGQKSRCSGFKSDAKGRFFSFQDEEKLMTRDRTTLFQGSTPTMTSQVHQRCCCCCSTSFTQTIVFGSIVFLLLGSARWARSIFSSYCPLSSKQCHWLTSATGKIMSSEIFFGMLGIKPGAAGSGSKYGNHCAFLPLLLVYFP